MEEGAAVRDPSHVTPKVNLCTHTVFYGQSTVFSFFGGIHEHKLGAVIYMYL